METSAPDQDSLTNFLNANTTVCGERDDLRVQVQMLREQLDTNVSDEREAVLWANRISAGERFLTACVVDNPMPILPASASDVVGLMRVFPKLTW